MFGEENDEGIIPRVCHSLLTQSSSSSSAPSAVAPLADPHTVQFSFQITYIEIFLERVRDLLSSLAAVMVTLHECLLLVGVRWAGLY
jgi:hypothetical protein